MSESLHSVDPDTLLAHHAWMRRLARRLVFDDAEADDVVQEAWLKATERPPRQAESLRAWLGTVVRNAARQLARGESRRTRRERAVARPEGLPSTADLVARAEARRTLTEATLSLDEPFRTTILLRFFEGLPPREIARQQQVPVETVRSRVRRGIAYLRVALDSRHGGSRASWLAALAPLTAPPVPGATGPGQLPVDAPPVPAAAALGTVAGGLAAAVLGLVVGRAALPDAPDPLSDLRTGIAIERAATTRLAEASSEMLTRADVAKFEAGALRAESRHRATRVIAAATGLAMAAGHAPAPVADVARCAPTYLFHEHADALGGIDWSAAGRDFAALIRAIQDVAEPLATGQTPSPDAIGDVQSCSGPVNALALRLRARGIPGATPNLVLAHPAVMANLVPPAMEALGVPLSAAQETHLERLARGAARRYSESTGALGDDAILLRRMAVESSALLTWMEDVDSVLSPPQRELARPEAYRGQMGLDLLSPGILWPAGSDRLVSAGGASDLVERADTTLLAPAFPAGTAERLRAREVLQTWAARLPDTAFAFNEGAASGASGARRLLFWAERTATLVEALREEAARTDAQRAALARALRPLVPLPPSSTR